MTNELIKPEKPQHFVRDHVVIYTLGFVCLCVGLYFEYAASMLVFILITTGIPAWRFRDYYKANRTYQQAYNLHQYSNKTPATDHNVNANIERDKAEQQRKRQNASWWQFWRF